MCVCECVCCELRWPFLGKQLGQCAKCMCVVLCCVCVCVCCVCVCVLCVHTSM